MKAFGEAFHRKHLRKDQRNLSKLITSEISFSFDELGL